MVGEDQVHFVDFVVELHTEPVRHKVLHKVLARGRRRMKTRVRTRMVGTVRTRKIIIRIKIMMTSHTCGRRALVAVSK